MAAREQNSLCYPGKGVNRQCGTMELASVALATACRKCVWGVSASIGLSSGHGLARTAIELAHRASESLRLGLNELALAVHS
jgi:hypothetical protein